MQQAEQDQSGEGQLTVDEQVKVGELQLKQREQDRKDADTQSTIEQREQRQAGIDRTGDQRFILEKAKFDEDKKKQENQQ